MRQKAGKWNFHILKRDLFGFASRHVAQTWGTKTKNRVDFLRRKIEKKNN